MPHTTALSGVSASFAISGSSTTSPMSRACSIVLRSVRRYAISIASTYAPASVRWLIAVPNPIVPIPPRTSAAPTRTSPLIGIAIPANRIPPPMSAMPTPMPTMRPIDGPGIRSSQPIFTACCSSAFFTGRSASFRRHSELRLSRSSEPPSRRTVSHASFCGPPSGASLAVAMDDDRRIGQWIRVVVGLDLRDAVEVLEADPAAAGELDEGRVDRVLIGSAIANDRRQGGRHLRGRAGHQDRRRVDELGVVALAAPLPPRPAERSEQGERRADQPERRIDLPRAPRARARTSGEAVRVTACDRLDDRPLALSADGERHEGVVDDRLELAPRSRTS